MYDGKKDKAKDYHLQLHMAATNGNVGLVKFALDHGAAIDSVVNGFLPLQLACISDNNIAVVQYLIDRGAQVNAQRWSKKHSADKSQAVAGAIGSTALHVACANGCSKIVDLLLRNDARVDLKDKYGSRPLDIAAAKHHMEIVKLLETFGALQQGDNAFQERRSMDVIYLKKHPLHQPFLSTNSSTTTTTSSPSFCSSSSSSSFLDDRAERMRRPSLPSVFEGKSYFNKRKTSSPALDIPPLSTLPPAPHHQQYSRANVEIATDSTSHSIDIVRHRRPSRQKLPELASSKSSDDTMVGTPPQFSSSLPPQPNNSTGGKNNIATKHDWYSYGVLHHDGNENYLTSLERRAYGLDDVPTRQSFDQVRPHRLSLDAFTGTSSSLTTHHEQQLPAPGLSCTHPSLPASSSPSFSSPRPSLKRCSSDGGHLRTTALMNAMAAKKSPTTHEIPLPPLPRNHVTSVPTDSDPAPSSSLVAARIVNETSDISHGGIGISHPVEPVRRQSVTAEWESYESEALRQFEEKEMKKAWWSAFGGRKSMDVATHQRHHQLQQRRNSYSRSSLDFRPSFDALSHRAWQQGENATGEDVDMNFEADEYDDDECEDERQQQLQQRKQRRPGFFTRWVGSWNRK